MGTSSQTYNPISEAKDVLTAKEMSPDQDEVVPSDDITLVGNININQLREDEIHLKKAGGQIENHPPKNKQKLDQQINSNTEKVSEEIQKKK
jgi:hypothetical protein